MTARKPLKPPGRYMIAAGGTGGHLFPAQALAEELQARDAKVDLITDDRGHRYGDSFPANNVYEVPSATFSLGLRIKNLKGLIRNIRGVVAAQRILHRTQPEVLIGFGGYPTLPPLAAALLQGMPTLLHEQNAVMGRVNRLFAFFAKTIACGFPHIKNVGNRVNTKIRHTGNPVRDVVLERQKSAYAPPGDLDEFRILVVGGSQGAQVFSDVVPQAIADLPDNLRMQVKLVQQARVEDMERVRSTYAEIGFQAEIAPFFNRLPERIANAHLIIARAGASTVSELAIIGRPAILVPLPHALDNDQLHNASYFVNAGGGWLVDQSEFTADRLSGLLVKLRYSPNELAAAAAGAAELGKPDAVRALADLVEQLAAKRRGDTVSKEESEAMAWPAIGPGKTKSKTEEQSTTTDGSAP